MKKNLLKIDPAYSKEEFLRKAWISLAQEDAPIDIFDSDFTDINEEQYRILFSNATYETTWEAQIGHNRLESYTDFETYYEKIPYTAYESKYDYSTKRTEQVAVTKYRQEQRQRQVTKQRLVTDWNSGSGEHAGQATCVECVDHNDNYSRSRFINDYDEEHVSHLSTQELIEQPDMLIDDDVMDIAYQSHKEKIETNLRSSLPGDKQESVSYRITDYTPTSASLLKAPGYTASITYKGENYEKRGFAFGNMTMSKTEVPNPVSVEKEKEQLTKETEAKIKKNDDMIDTKFWNSTRLFTLISIILLFFSAVSSLFIHVTFIVVVLFIGAAGMFAFSKFFNKISLKNIKNKTTEDNVAARVACEMQVRNYEKIQKEKLLVALNKKLTSLGLQPVDENEFNKA